jgi:hypothetical protein
MDSLRTPAIERDRGLGTAYERWHFYKLVDEWAAEYRIESALEGPVDGMAGISGVHCAGLARRGIHVTTASLTVERTQLARSIYVTAGGQDHVDVRLVVDPLRVAEELKPCDLVLAYHALPFVGDWRDYLRAVAKLARKVLVVTVCNPDHWGVAAIRAAGWLRGRGDLGAPETWRTDVLVPELSRVGRVRDHLYFDVPWWPDLQVAPGQLVLDRARELFFPGRSEAGFNAEKKAAKLAERFVYGPRRWPYFEGEGWADELSPALRRHPAFEGTPRRLKARLAHLHAFVVDMRAG